MIILKVWFLMFLWSFWGFDFWWFHAECLLVSFLVVTEKVENIGCKSTSMGQFLIFESFSSKLIKFEGLEAWEYQNGVQLDVPNSLVYSKVEQLVCWTRGRVNEWHYQTNQWRPFAGHFSVFFENSRTFISDGTQSLRFGRNLPSHNLPFSMNFRPLPDPRFLDLVLLFFF